MINDYYKLYYKRKLRKPLSCYQFCVKLFFYVHIYKKTTVGFPVSVFFYLLLCTYLRTEHDQSHYTCVWRVVGMVKGYWYTVWSPIIAYQRIALFLQLLCFSFHWCTNFITTISFRLFLLSVSSKSGSWLIYFFTYPVKLIQVFTSFL